MSVFHTVGQSESVAEGRSDGGSDLAQGAVRGAARMNNKIQLLCLLHPLLLLRGGRSSHCLIFCAALSPVSGGWKRSWHSCLTYHCARQRHLLMPDPVMGITLNIHRVGDL